MSIQSQPHDTNLCSHSATAHITWSRHSTQGRNDVEWTTSSSEISLTNDPIGTFMRSNKKRRVERNTTTTISPLTSCIQQKEARARAPRSEATAARNGSSRGRTSFKDHSCTQHGPTIHNHMGGPGGMGGASIDNAKHARSPAQQGTPQHDHEKLQRLRSMPQNDHETQDSNPAEACRDNSTSYVSGDLACGHQQVRTR